MQEIELKFQIPPGQLGAVRQALHALPADAAAAAGSAPLHTVPMLAAYFDTPDRALARHKMALRVRREGEHWVQTFKAAGADAMSRVEDNQPLPAPPHGEGLAADLSLHRLPAARQALDQALRWQADADPTGARCGLQPLYETCFRREQVEIDARQGRVAICLDEGELAAGALREPLCELEFELISGHAGAVIDTARQWVDRHGLWLDVHSKAYRGTRLAATAAGEPRRARPAPAPARPWPSAQAGGAGIDIPADAPHAFLAQSMEAAAANWSEVAALHEGWRNAADAWHASLRTLLDAADEAPPLRALLQADEWQRTRDLAARVHGIAPGAGHDGCAPAKAQHLATMASTTHWALDVLAALKKG